MDALQLEALPEIVDAMTLYGLRAIGAVVMFIIGYLVAGWASRVTADRARKSSIADDTIALIMGRIVRISILGITLVAVLNQFGVPTASLVAVMGTAGLAIGLALQGTLSNVAAGVMLLSFRPFNVGDWIEAGGMTGQVDEIGLFLTRMHTSDNIRVIMPNNELWGSPIRNFSTNDTRRIDMVFGIGYEDDIDAAVAVINDLLRADPRVLDEPKPLVAVGELADSSVNLLVRPWVQRADFSATKFDLTVQVKKRFDAEGISMPFPQREVHLRGQAAA